MSNYIRSLLRFEKARAAASESGDEPPLSERQARLRDEESVRSLFEDDGRSGGNRIERPMELDDAGFPMLEDVHLPRRRRRSLWSRLPFIGGRKHRRRHFEATAEDGFFSDRQAATEGSYGRLLDSLRSADTRYSAPGIVLASTSSRRSVRSVIDGLTAQAHTMGVRLAVAELVFADAERVLRSREDSSTSLPTTSSLELTGSGSDQILQDWFERATAGVDLLIIEGPPLARSVDAALMARAGDGLVIVAEPQATLVEEFETTIERAKASGCFVLGLVLHRHTHWLPRFLRGFFYKYPRSIRNRPGSRTDIERPR